MSRFRRICMAIMLSATLPVIAVAESQPSESPFGRKHRRQIKAESARRVAAGEAPSICLALVRGSGPEFVHCVGQMRLDPPTPATVETLYNVGSVTKTFTAMLMMILRDEGRLSLEDEITRHLPPQVGMTRRRGIPTLYQIATHTSGMPRDAPNRSKNGYSVEDLYLGLGRSSLEQKAGGTWRYSNLAYDLLGHALERVGEAPYESLLRDRVLSPLGMRESKVQLTPDDLNRFAAHYWPEDAERVERPPWIWTEVAGSAGLTSTVSDMARYISFMLAPGDDPSTALRRASLHQMLGEIPPSAAGLKQQCIAWIVTHEPERGPWYVHGGEVDGHGAYVSFSPPLDIGIVVLTNIGGATATDFGEWIERSVHRRQRKFLE